MNAGVHKVGGLMVLACLMISILGISWEFSNQMLFLFEIVNGNVRTLLLK